MTLEFHSVTIGHETVMGKATFFSGQPPTNQRFDFEGEYPYLNELTDTKTQVINTIILTSKQFYLQL